ncbi:hypothetical protein NHP22001_01680 [Helicobacter sp. NHP22-001]|nr:hypothetical protein NHP22001_01680 [Helicobacter sp. NHP22-001]
MFNTIGHLALNKHEFISGYKFNLCFENFLALGYTTEKKYRHLLRPHIPHYALECPQLYHKQNNLVNPIYNLKERYLSTCALVENALLWLLKTLKQT